MGLLGVVGGSGGVDVTGSAGEGAGDGSDSAPVDSGPAVTVSVIVTVGVDPASSAAGAPQADATSAKPVASATPTRHRDTTVEGRVRYGTP